MLCTGQLLSGRAPVAVLLEVVMMVVHHRISWLRSQIFQSLVAGPFRWVHWLSGMVLYSPYKHV